MNLLSRLRLRTKLALLMGLSTLALIASIGVAASLMHQRMFDDRVDKLKATIDMTMAVATALQNQVTAKQITQDQAMARLRELVHAMRFDAGDGYISVQRLGDAMLLIHGTEPNREGKPSAAKDAKGRLIIELIRDALRNRNSGTIGYLFPKPGQSLAQPKVAYVARFAPLDAAFLAGAYTDDLDAAYHATLRELILVGGAILLLTLLAAWLINRDITGSLGRLKTAMEHLSHGALEAPIPGADRRDEVGEMAGAMLVFKDGMQRADRLATEQQHQRTAAEEKKRAALIKMAHAIETEAKDAIAKVDHRSAAMEANARSMNLSAEHTGKSAESAAAAAAQALANAQTVAGAAEQLAASIREIGGQVEHSTQVVARAVEAGRTTRAAIETLNQQVGRIGAVADMISEIAARTNLLALNATIEAARAGDAGKGFAVVASEVKALATQTARSTEEIARHIGEVRTATGASVTAVGRIETTISEINSIAGSIAASVEEQGAATAEIARNVNETAAASNAMTDRTREVSVEAERTGQQAAEVLDNVAALNDAMRGLQSAVVRVVRTATSDVDRRAYRRRPCLVDATVTQGGQSAAAVLTDISERGCFVQTELRCPAGQTIDLALAQGGWRSQATVVEPVEDGWHVVFSGDGLPTEEVDRISLATVAVLISKTKDDHVAFVRRVTDAVAAGRPFPPGELANHHHCRLGRWYDGVSDTATIGLASFKALAMPHVAVHEAGQQALVALAAGDMAAAQRAVTDLRAQSEHVLRCLDAFGREYPTTISQSRAVATERAA